MLRDDRLELPDELAVTAELKVGFEPRLHGGEPQLLEPGDLALGEEW